MTITYLTGDATQPIKKPALIMHVCNDIGGWGRGFVLALDKISPRPRNAYRAKTTYEVSEVQFVDIDGKLAVANMIAQHDIRKDDGGNPPIRYWALAECLLTVVEWCDLHPAYSIHAPRIGCGLAGGSWSVVEPLIDFYLRDREVYIYDLPGAKG